MLLNKSLTFSETEKKRVLSIFIVIYLFSSYFGFGKKITKRNRGEKKERKSTKFLFFVFVPIIKSHSEKKEETSFFCLHLFYLFFSSSFTTINHIVDSSFHIMESSFCKIIKPNKLKRGEGGEIETIVANDEKGGSPDHQDHRMWHHISSSYFYVEPKKEKKTKLAMYREKEIKMTGAQSPSFSSTTHSHLRISNLSSKIRPKSLLPSKH